LFAGGNLTIGGIEYLTRILYLDVHQKLTSKDVLTLNKFTNIKG